MVQGGSQPLLRLRVHCRKASRYISSFRRLIAIVGEPKHCSCAGETRVSLAVTPPVVVCGSLAVFASGAKGLFPFPRNSCKFSVSLGRF